MVIGGKGVCLGENNVVRERGVSWEVGGLCTLISRDLVKVWVAIKITA